MTKIDLTQLSKDALNNLVLTQVQQVTKLQLETDDLKLKLDKGQNLPVISANLPQTSSNKQKGSPIDKRSGNNNVPLINTIPLAALPDRIIKIKPKWQTKNRLQNCHKPKPK
jgi:hypothetical protein